jgi:hypothetical protein
MVFYKIYFNICEPSEVFNTLTYYGYLYETIYNIYSNSFIIDCYPFYFFNLLAYSTSVIYGFFRDLIITDVPSFKVLAHIFPLHLDYFFHYFYYNFNFYFYLGNLDSFDIFSPFKLSINIF